MNLDISSITGAYERGELKPAQIAQQVEAMFMEVLIESMEKSVDAEGGLYGDSSSSEIYRGLFRQDLAMALSNDLDTPLQEQLKDALERYSDAAGAHRERPVPTASPESGTLQLPVNGTVSSARGWRSDPISGEKRFHRGTDIAAPEGTPVRATESGRVLESGPRGSYGNTVVVETSDGRKLLYAHNLENRVAAGDRVHQGQIIALVGSTGRSTGPHVHFEVME